MATLQLFGRKKDRETQRGQRWLQERRVPFSFVDLEQKALSPGELDSVSRSVGGPDGLVDSQSKLYQTEGWAHRTFDAREELLAHPGLIKTPILRLGSQAVVGFDEPRWKALTGLK